MNELRIGLVLRFGVFASAFTCVFGILLVFLSHHVSFISPPAAALVERAGLLFLIYMQVVRVFLTGWLFLERREWIFVGCSIFIFLLLCYSVFWQA